jgi:LacI family repressor for deo operon, udp, cdd, tsx, nupC, and nupG
VNSTDEYRPRKRVSSHDVARVAEVSQSTVSLVFSGKATGRVSDQTRERVLDAAERLGYSPNTAARELRVGYSKTVALLTPVLGNSFFAAVHDSLARSARLEGVNVIIHPLAADDVSALPPFNRTVDGIVGCSLDWDKVRAAAQRIPTVLIDADPSAPVPTVNADVSAGARELALHLVSRPERPIIHLAADLSSWTFERRGSAMRAVFEGTGLHHSIIRTPATVGAARAQALRVFDQRTGPLTLVCDTDDMALGVYLAAASLGLGVPAEVSIASFDDREIDKWLVPGLTSVRIEAEVLGSTAMSLLRNWWHDDKPPASRIVPATLQLRGSVA